MQTWDARDYIAKVEKFFNKAYNAEQASAICETVRHLTSEDLNKVVDHMTKTRRTLPMLVDYFPAMKIVRGFKPEVEVKPVEQTKCKFCLDIGFTPTKQEDVPGRIWAICFCESGDREAALETDIPQLERTMRDMIIPFPAKDFKLLTENDLQEGELVSGLWDRVEWWQQEKQIARDYWAS